MDGDLQDKIRACRICRDRFALTQTAHAPRTVVWLGQGVRILVAGQAPGMRVHKAGKPFFDRSGDRLRAWMGIDSDVFYDRARVAVLPMAFCFPGYDAKGSDLPPPKVCSDTWHEAAMGYLGDVPLMLLIGGYAHKWPLAAKGGVTDTVQAWREHAPRAFALPHPSWRNTAWLKRNPWFEEQVIPALRQRVKEVLT